MKILIFFLCLPIQVFSQATKDRIIYLDSLEQLANEDDFHTLRIMKDYYTDAPGCMLYEYYKSGKKKLIGNLKDKYSLLKSGEFVSFYENGNRQSIFSFEDNLPIGKFFTWYEKGNIKSEGEFLKLKKQKKVGPIIKVNHYWSKIGIHRVIDGNGHFEDSDETSFSEGELKNGFKEGEWIGNDVLDNTSFIEKYKAGILLSGVSTDSLQRSYPYDNIYVEANPNQNREHFYRYIKKNLKVPAFIKKNQITGKVVVEFTVNKEGWVSKAKILNGLGYGLDEEVLRVIRNCDQWAPATKRGIPFEDQFTIPLYISYGEFR